MYVHSSFLSVSPVPHIHAPVTTEKIMGNVILALLPALATAEGAAGVDASAPVIDWTALVVAMIGVIGTAASALLGRVWVKYVKPWLEQRGLTDAAKIVVEAVEALLGRYCGEDKWKLALEKMAERGFYTDSQQVIDALKK